MRKSVALACLAALAVQPILGCCTCNWPPGPTQDPNPIPNPGPSPVVVDPTLPPQKFAVLASNLKAEVEDNQQESDFWYDLVLTYCTLLENGFTADNVFVLYGAGTDAAFSTYPAYSNQLCGIANATMTDYSLQNSNGMAKDNLCNILCCLSTGFPAMLNTSDECECLTDSDTGIGGFKCSQSGAGKLAAKLRPEDFLFIWVKGHGKSSFCTTTLRFTPNPHLYDYEVKELIKGLEPNRKALVFETCDAGGWLNDMQNADTAVTVSSGDPLVYSNCKETAYAAKYNEITGDGAGVFHGRFTHGFNAALRQLQLAGRVIDTDDNNLVSIQEGYNEATKRIGDEDATGNTNDYGSPMHPAIRIEDGIASCIFIRLPNPGKDHEVFTKDREKDNALVPSVPTEATPDLWISKNVDCAPMEDPIKKDNNHHLCARVHNIGCADPGKVAVTFFVKQCNSTGPETKIDGFITNLPPAESSVVPALWPAVSAGGDYCIRAELTAGTDAPIADLPTGEDNNKAQIKITVVN